LTAIVGEGATTVVLPRVLSPSLEGGARGRVTPLTLPSPPEGERD